MERPSIPASLAGSYRLTGPRRAVLDAVESRAGPFTVEDLCAELPAVGRATVFRTVKLLHEQGAVCRLAQEDGGVRYQRSRADHHHHVTCRTCGAVTEFADPELDELIRASAHRAGFRLESHSVELYGLCPACAKGYR